MKVCTVWVPCGTVKFCRHDPRMLPTLLSWRGQAGLAFEPSIVAHTDQWTKFVLWKIETVLPMKMVQPFGLLQLTVVGLSRAVGILAGIEVPPLPQFDRSEEHTSELQSRFGISYAVFCLKKK